jgi:nucleoside-diphosphate-sugar epimerase
MKVFVAGASGAIGKPLIAELIRQGHTVTGMTQSEFGAAKLVEFGARAELANAFDASAVESALRRSDAEIVIDQLTSLPKNAADMPARQAGDIKLRIEGGGNLHRAAQNCGVRLYIQQGSGFFLKADRGLADESSKLAVDASPGIVPSARMYLQLEALTLNSSLPGIVLRYGFFYGPNTWYHPDGAAADQVGNSNFQSSDRDKEYGHSFTSRTQLTPPSPHSQPRPESTTWWIATPHRSASGSQSSQNLSALHRPRM